jgi:hypothetical protein
MEEADMKPFALSIPTAFAATLAALTLLAPRTAHAAACTPATVAASDIPTWKPPKVSQGACTQTEANKFEVAFNASNATPDSMEGSVSAGCKQCIFSQDATSANWQVIVWTNRASSEGIYNTASCLAAAGASQGCAGARYGADTCAFDACGACTDQTSFGTCNSSARSGECKSYADEATSNCGASTSAFTACGIDPTDGTGSGVAKLVMQVCGAAPSGGTGSGMPSTDPPGSGSSNNGGTDNSGSNSGDTGDSSNQGSNGTPSKGSSNGAMSSLQLDGPPNTAGGCSASGSSASAQPFALALVGLLVAARRKRSARNESK